MPAFRIAAARRRSGRPKSRYKRLFIMLGCFHPLFNLVAGVSPARGPGNRGDLLAAAAAAADLASEQRTGQTAGDHPKIAAFAFDLDHVYRFDHATIGAIPGYPPGTRVSNRGGQQGLTQDCARITITQTQIGRDPAIGRDSVPGLDRVSTLVQARFHFFQQEPPRRTENPDCCDSAGGPTG